MPVDGLVLKTKQTNKKDWQEWYIGQRIKSKLIYASLQKPINIHLIFEYTDSEDSNDK